MAEETKTVGRKKNRYEIHRAQYASLKMTQGVIALDALSLDACYHVTADDDHALFSLNRENGLIAVDTTSDQVVGYSMLLPLTTPTYEMIRQGRFVDTAMRPDMVVRYDRPGIYDLYFASVVIHPDHRGARLLVNLMDVMIQDFIDLAERGIFIRRMLADVVSKEGEKFCQVFGLKEVCHTDHNSKIYEVSGLPPKMRISRPITQRLYDVYNEKFNALNKVKS